MAATDWPRRRIESARQTTASGPADDLHDEMRSRASMRALRNITTRWGGKAANYWHVAIQQ